jgi:flagellum-specific peptidoglycan hydrolase FlgJ
MSKKRINMKQILLIISLTLPSIGFSQKVLCWNTLSLDQKVAIAKTSAESVYNGIEFKIKESHRAYIKRFAWLAVYDYNQYGVLASIKIAQGGTENGWGLILDRCLLVKNHFSIQCKLKGNHKKHGCLELNDAGVISHFAAYETDFDSWRAHTMLLLSPKYKNLFQDRDYEHWTNKLNGKYAASPNYGKALILVIRQYELYKFDVRI